MKCKGNVKISIFIIEIGNFEIKQTQLNQRRKEVER
jgi:hypothetical protein